MNHVVIERVGRVQTVTLNRPSRHNAFDAKVIHEITEVFSDLSSDADVSAVILTAAGPTFCSGADLEWMRASSALGRTDNVRNAERLFDMFRAVRDLPVPVIARVFGHCYGGGMGLVAASDVVAAEDTTKFCFSEVKWGLIPAVISPFVLRKTSLTAASEWCLTGRIFGATEARAAGLINFCGPLDDVDQFVRATVDQIARAAPRAVRATKALQSKLFDLDWASVRKQTTELIADQRVSAEGQYGLGCFLEKKDPNWSEGLK